MNQDYRALEKTVAELNLASGFIQKIESFQQGYYISLYEHLGKKIDLFASLRSPRIGLVAPVSDNIKKGLLPLLTPQARPSFLHTHVKGRAYSCAALLPGERALTFTLPREDLQLTLKLYPPAALVVTSAENKVLFSTSKAHHIGSSYAPAARTLPAQSDESLWSPAAFLEDLQKESRLRKEKTFEKIFEGQKEKISALEGSLRHAKEREERFREQGALLLASAGFISEGAQTFKGTLSSGSAIVIPLERHLSVGQNGSAFFEKAKKEMRKAQHIEEQLTQEREKLEHLTPQEISQRSEMKKKRDKLLWHIGQFPVFIGRSAKENEQIFRLARPWHLFLHARDVPGAYVFVAKGRAPLSQEELLDAATLALEHSKARGESQGHVIFTEKRYLTLPKNQKKRGEILYTSERSLLVRLEPGRLSRLRERRESGKDY